MINILKMWIDPQEYSTTTKIGLLVSALGMLLIMEGLPEHSDGIINSSGNAGLIVLGASLAIIGSLISGILLIAWLMSWGAVTPVVLFVYKTSFMWTIWWMLSIPSLIVFLGGGIMGSGSDGGGGGGGKHAILEDIKDLLEEIKEKIK